MTQILSTDNRDLIAMEDLYLATIDALRAEVARLQAANNDLEHRLSCAFKLIDALRADVADGRNQ